LLRWQPTIVALILVVGLYVSMNNKPMQDMGTGMSSMGTASKDAIEPAKNIGVGVKAMGDAANTVASSKLPPHIAHMLGLGMGLWGLGVGIALGLYFMGKRR